MSTSENSVNPMSKLLLKLNALVTRLDEPFPGQSLNDKLVIHPMSYCSVRIQKYRR